MSAASKRPVKAPLKIKRSRQLKTCDSLKSFLSPSCAPSCHLNCRRVCAFKGAWHATTWMSLMDVPLDEAAQLTLLDFSLSRIHVGRRSLEYLFVESAV